MEADYQYDVFFSYKRHSLTLEWTAWVNARLQFFLSMELGREANVFFDARAIETGDCWPERLKQAIRSSRCLVGVWSPLYFQSGWCCSEWRSFRERERLLELVPNGLIAPLRYHDGEHFPEDARGVQWIDVAPYTSTSAAFWKSERAIELEDRVKDLARQVAVIVARAPVFQEDWPVVDADGLAPPKIGLAKL
jgi:hypothetical protein